MPVPISRNGIVEPTSNTFILRYFMKCYIDSIFLYKVVRLYCKQNKQKCKAKCNQALKKSAMNRRNGTLRITDFILQITRSVQSINLTEQSESKHLFAQLTAHALGPVTRTNMASCQMRALKSQHNNAAPQP